MTSRAKVWLPPLIYMAVIFVLSSQSTPLPELRALVWDKILHTCEYAGLAVLVARAFRRENLGFVAVIVLSIAATSIYGATDEWHQWFVPGRSSDIHDWIADTVGGTIGVAAYLSAVGRRRSV